jgi:hypothetical protein
LDPVHGLRPVPGGNFPEYYLDFYLMTEDLPYQKFAELALIPNYTKPKECVGYLFDWISKWDEKDRLRAETHIYSLFHGIPPQRFLPGPARNGGN